MSIPLSFTLNGFKFFSFIIPLFLLSVVLSSEEDYFNINLFLVLLFIFLFLSSSLITFDSSNGFNFVAILNGASKVIDIACIFIFLGVPIFMIVGIIWAFYKGEISNAIKVIVFLGLFLAFTMITFFFFEITGIQLMGVTSFVSEFYAEIISFIINLPITLYQGADSIIEKLPIDFDLPDLPSVYADDFTFNAMWTSFNTLNYSEVVLTIHDTLPIIISVFCLIVALMMLKKDWENEITDFITKISKPKIERKKKRHFAPNLNYGIAFYILFLLVSAFVIFLSYKNSYGEDPAQDYQMIGFFGLYLIMSCIPLAIMISTDLVYYKHSSLTKTIEGVVYGVVGLALMTRLFFMRNVMNAYSVQDIEGSMIYIINTFIFVAPSESILFHVFWCGLVAGFLRKYSKNKLKELDKRGVFPETKTGKLIKIEDEIDIEAKLENYYKVHQKTKQDALLLALTESRIATLEKEKRRLLRLPEDIDVDFSTIFGRASNLTYFILFGVIFSSFIFASLHWIILYYTTGTDFYIFWLSGLGVIYFAGGCWFIFISFRYGWLAGILTHAIHNTLSIILILLLVGV